AAVVSVKLSEGTVLQHKKSYVRIYGELLEVRESLENVYANYAENQSYLVDSVIDVYENLKVQVRVFVFDLDLSLFSTDNVVVEGKIVSVFTEDEVPVSDFKVPVENPILFLAG
ncbi:hypothetical protein DF186_14385, partial [Enterococcus hirae]